MRTKLLLLLAVFALPAGSALAQVNLMPDKTLRLPTPPGSGLSVENKAFVDQALTAASVTIEAGRLAAQKAQTGAVRDLARDIAADQQKLQDDLTKLSETKGYAPQSLATPPAELAALTRLQGGSGEFDRQYLTGQYQADRWLFAVYQTEMAQTQDQQLRNFAAERELMLRKHLEGIQKAADALGLRLEVPKSAPQY
jgi:predicted outer membrane protein